MDYLFDPGYAFSDSMYVLLPFALSNVVSSKLSLFFFI